MALAGASVAAAARVTQIVPDARPGRSGVGDYALSVAQVLRDQSGIDSVFVVPSAGTLSRALESTAAARSIVLHYSGYGYDDHGTPRWLLEGLSRWKAQDRERTLITIFHELYAVSPPWRRAFWLTRAQKALAADLARASDSCITARHESAELIRQWRGPA